MLKKIFISNIILFIIVSLLLTSIAFAISVDTDNTDGNSVEHVVEVVNNEVYDDSQQTEQLSDITYVLNMMEDCKAKMDAAHQMAESARVLGYEETHDIILTAQDHWQDYYSAYVVYDNIYAQLEEAQLEMQKKYEEYPVAYEVWMLLKEAGYNDYVCAGIIGNMMCECGGNTLNLVYDVYNPTKYYYGLCQWNKSAYVEVFDCNVEEQVKFLIDTIQREFDVFGYAYKRGFNYEQFLDLDNEKNAALAFAKCYERCGSGSYSKRQSCATIAYEYFVNQ